MSPSKILILVMLGLSTFYNSETKLITQTPQVQNNNSTTNQNCFCFDKYVPQPIKVSDIMQTSKGLERLVVYLYRDLDVDEVAMYTPSLEKQRLIPDLPIETGDGWISISNETIKTIFSKNPDKILMQETGSPIDEYDSSASNDEFNHNSGNDVLPSDNIFMYSDSESDRNEVYVKDSPIYSIENDQNVNNLIRYIKEEEDNINIKNTELPQIKFIDYEPVHDDDDAANDELVEQVDGQHTDDIPLHQINVPYVVQLDQEKNDQYGNWLLEKLKEEEKDIINTKTNIDDLKYLDLAISDQAFQQIIIPDTFIHDESIYENTPPTHDTPVSYSQTSDPSMASYEDSVYKEVTKENIPGYSYSAYMKLSNKKKHSQFNDWILEQLEGLKSLESEGRGKFDLTSIGDSILQILFKNGMFITNNGILVDSNGKVLDIHDLSLMPIIVGNTEPLRRLLQQQNEILSPQSHYVQAVLVTVINPLKILGLIPLEQTYLPSSIHSTIQNSSEIKHQFMDSNESAMPRIKNISIYGVANSGSQESKMDNVNNKAVNSKKIDKSKSKKSNKNGEKEKPTSYLSPTYYNINGNENNIGRYFSRKLGDTLSLRRGVRPGADETNESNFKSGNTLRVSSGKQAKSESNVGRLFLPRLALYDEPLQILPTRKSQNTPLNIVLKRYQTPAIVKVPDFITDILDVAFKDDNLPENAIISKENDDTSQFTKLRSITTSTNMYENNNPVNILKGLRINKSLKNNAMPGFPVGQQRNLKRKFHLPAQQSVLDQRGKPTFNFYKIPDVYKHAQVSSGELSSPWINELPESLKEISGYDIAPLANEYQRFYENIPNEVSLMQQSDISSRTGTVNDENSREKSPNSEQWSVMIENTDDDDDDGDFRIIGGNAATGSGTPLSNKGRSGYMF